ncbi:hypothetical protein CEE37_07555 [candidate division LCP-89 bacterium B3_LCP]|uniref:Uncharacterized protein n=1 Tax=candidate division LCP-89 bacterium B3_LCP TaxID=2012998 RepID=A0A532V0T8_UNCL8|nr:MAG: hypothetical protein CEE37_07555 [candidate division LCP-89 bacterium B3_LCP]
MIRRLLYIILCLLPFNLHAMEINPAGRLLLLNTGARAIGMGGCGTLVGESYSGLYNPAAQMLSSNISGSVFINSYPYFAPGYDYLAITAAGKTEFGHIGFSYLSRKGIDGSDLPPEEISSLVLSGRVHKKLNLTYGFGIKILATHKANFIPVNQAFTRTYKMAFDLGLVYYRILPGSTIGNPRYKDSDLKTKFGNPFPRGFTVAVAFQNMGGKVEFEQSIDIEMLPQAFRADFMWGAFESRWLDLRAVAQAQKLLVERNELGGYKTATEAFFQAWSGKSNEGAWVSRAGIELSVFGLISGRIGWSRDHKERSDYVYHGVGIGPEWLRLGAARQHQPGTDLQMKYETRYDLTVNINYERIRGWFSKY